MNKHINFVFVTDLFCIYTPITMASDAEIKDATDNITVIISIYSSHYFNALSVVDHSVKYFDS